MQSLEKSTGATCGVRGVRLAVAAAAVTSEVVSGVKRERGGGGKDWGDGICLRRRSECRSEHFGKGGIGHALNPTVHVWITTGSPHTSAEV